MVQGGERCTSSSMLEQASRNTTSSMGSIIISMNIKKLDWFFLSCQTIISAISCRFNAIQLIQLLDSIENEFNLNFNLEFHIM
ncbi:hypothetical protein L9F63_004944, partial [Diploptera punctata]